MNRIKELRNQKGITQDELGKILNVQKSAVSKYELGRAVPGADVLKKLATYFNVTSDYILGLSDNPHGEPFAGQDGKHFLLFAGQQEPPAQSPAASPSITGAAVAGSAGITDAGITGAGIAGAAAGAATGVGLAASALGVSYAAAPIGVPLVAAGAVSAAAVAAYHSIKHLLDITGTPVDDEEVIGTSPKPAPPLLVEPEESKMVSQYRTLSDEDKKVVQRLIDSLAQEKEEPKDDEDLLKNEEAGQ